MEKYCVVLRRIPVFTNQPSRIDLYMRKIKRSSLDKLSDVVTGIKGRFKRN